MRTSDTVKRDERNISAYMVIVLILAIAMVLTGVFLRNDRLEKELYETKQELSVKSFEVRMLQESLEFERKQK